MLGVISQWLQFLFGAMEKFWKERRYLHDIGNVMNARNRALRGFNPAHAVLWIVLPNKKPEEVLPRTRAEVLAQEATNFAELFPVWGSVLVGDAPPGVTGTSIPVSEHARASLSQPACALQVRVGPRGQ